MLRSIRVDDSADSEGGPTPAEQAPSLLASDSFFSSDGDNSSPDLPEGKLEILDSPLKNEFPIVQDELYDLPGHVDSQASSRIICYTCHQPIIETSLLACGNQYHPEHFRCQGMVASNTRVRRAKQTAQQELKQCNRPLADADFFERDGQVLCTSCFMETSFPTCKFCSEPIRDVSLLYENITHGIALHQCSWRDISSRALFLV